MENLYIVRYKLHGAPKEEVFDAKDLETARKLAKEWCELFQYKLVLVREFYRNLAKEIEIEKKKETPTNIVVKPVSSKTAGALPTI